MESTSPLQEGQTFYLFPKLPLEIQSYIWQAAIAPHIIRWIRIDDEARPNSNSFPYSQRRSPIHQVCRLARKTALLHSKYVRPSGDTRVMFSPTVDYLYLDPSWTGLDTHGLAKNPLASLNFDFKQIRKIMVHPNYTDNRLKPGFPLENMRALQQILVVADEKSIGVQSKFMLASVYDLKKYYEGAKRRDPTIQIPYIAVGCLGWVGEDKIKFHHDDEDRRQLVAVFDGHSEMKEHLCAMREKEVEFLNRSFSHRKSGFRLKFKPGYSMNGPVFVRSSPSEEALPAIPQAEDKMDIDPSCDVNRTSHAVVDSSRASKSADLLPPPYSEG